MNITILNTSNYLPFNLYFNSIYNILHLKHNILFINNISLLPENTDFLILFINYYELLLNTNIYNSKIIFIVADYLLNVTHKQELLFNFLEINSKNIYIWEYNQLNIKIYNKSLYKISWTFIPLSYNNYLEDLYKQHANRIPYNNKQTDILFLGSLNPRRTNLLNKINNKYKLVIMENNYNINQYINLIENSKIILNIYSNEINKPFDYYRFALLYTNKNLVMTETLDHIDTTIEQNLLSYKEWMIMFDYNDDNILDQIETYLNKSNDEIDQITQLAYDNFNKFNMETHINNFFTTTITT